MRKPMASNTDAALVLDSQLQMLALRPYRPRCFDLDIPRDKDRLRIAITGGLQE